MHSILAKTSQSALCYSPAAGPVVLLVVVVLWFLVLGIQGQLVSDTDDMPFAFSSMLGKFSCTMFSSNSTAFDKIISFCVQAHTAAVVVCSGESSTIICTVALPSTGILVLLAAPIA